MQLDLWEQYVIAISGIAHVMKVARLENNEMTAVVTARDREHQMCSRLDSHSSSARHNVALTQVYLDTYKHILTNLSKCVFPSTS